MLGTELARQRIMRRRTTSACRLIAASRIESDDSLRWSLTASVPPPPHHSARSIWVIDMGIRTQPSKRASPITVEQTGIDRPPPFAPDADKDPAGTAGAQAQRWTPQRLDWYRQVNSQSLNCVNQVRSIASRNPRSKLLGMLQMMVQVYDKNLAAIDAAEAASRPAKPSSPAGLAHAGGFALQRQKLNRLFVDAVRRKTSEFPSSSYAQQIYGAIGDRPAFAHQPVFQPRRR